MEVEYKCSCGTATPAKSHANSERRESAGTSQLLHCEMNNHWLHLHSAADRMYRQKSVLCMFITANAIRVHIHRHVCVVHAHPSESCEVIDPE